MDLERINLLVTTFHALLNVPNTSNIQREISDELTAINGELSGNPQFHPRDEPQTTTDGSGGNQGAPEESLFQGRRV